VQFPVFRGDFFPYQNDLDQYWSGYYTSRPNFKRLIRHLSNVAHTSTTLYSLAKLRNFNTSVDLVSLSDKLVETVGLMMHHDTITGTSVQAVINDNTKKISDMLE
jgi:hypothetical protein